MIMGTVAFVYSSAIYVRGSPWPGFESDKIFFSPMLASREQRDVRRDQALAKAFSMAGAPITGSQQSLGGRTSSQQYGQLTASAVEDVSRAQKRLWMKT